MRLKILSPQALLDRLGERRFFRNLSVFAAGWTMHSAGAMCATAAGEPDMLETIREYALEGAYTILDKT